MDSVLKKITLEEIEIPGIPGIAAQVLALLEDEYCSMGKLEKVILKDQALTAGILRIANAPFYSTGKSVKTLSEAIMAVGLRNLLALISIISLTHQLHGKQIDPDLMHHAMAVSAASAALARHAKVVAVEEALVGGLLHDIGKTIFLASAPAQYRALKEKVNKERRPFIEVENELLSFNHCHIGGMVAEKWRLPELYVHIIENHHNENAAELKAARKITYEDMLCYIIRLADKVILDAGAGIGRSTEKKAQELLDVFNIGESIYVEIVKEISAYCPK